MAVPEGNSPAKLGRGDHFRHLGDKLNGVIFGCTDATYNECVDDNIFGLPATHFVYVKQIRVGTPLFLFNYSRREMHGVFAAYSEGQMNIKPDGWTRGKTAKTSFPAQVRVQRYKMAEPLKEHQFKAAIRSNYDEKGPWFTFELDEAQVNRLCSAFHCSVPRIRQRGSQSILAPPLIKRLPIQTAQILQSPARLPNKDAKTKTSNAENFTRSIPNSSPVLSQLVSHRDRQLSFKHDKRNLNCAEREWQPHAAAEVYDDSEINHNKTISLTRRGQSRSRRKRSIPSTSVSHLTPGEVAEIAGRKTLAESNGITIRPSNEKDVSTLGESETMPRDEFLLKYALSKEPERTFSVADNTDTLILLGGLDTTQYAMRLEMLNADVEEWETSFIIPGLDFIDGQAVAVDNTVAILGGGVETCMTSNAVEMLRCGWKRWKSAQPMPFERPYFAAAAIRDAIFTAAGGDPYGESDVVERYDCETNIWTKEPRLQYKRYGAAACSDESLVFVTGGGVKIGTTNFVELRDVRTDSWQCLPSMSVDRKHHQCIYYKDQLWVMGGQKSDGVLLHHVEVFDLRNQQWSNATPLLNARAFFTVEILHDQLHVIGGAASLSELAFLGGEVYSPETNTWKSGLKVGSHGVRGHHGSCVIRCG